jgi:hypothetical protein
MSRVRIVQKSPCQGRFGFGNDGMDDTIEISGLNVLLEEDADPPYLDLTLRCNRQEYRAVILAAEEEWAVNVRSQDGALHSEDGELFPSQAAAILAAMLIALDHSTRSDPAF